MTNIANITKTTNTIINIYGFDTEEGMTSPIDYSDKTKNYNTKNFPMKINNFAI